MGIARKNAVNREARPPHTPKPLLALVLALFVPGLGQVYYGDFALGGFIYLLYLTASCFFLVLASHLSPSWVLPWAAVGWLTTTLLYLYGVIESLLTTRKLAKVGGAKTSTRGIVCLGILLAASLLNELVERQINSKYIAIMPISTASMMPTILPEEFLLTRGNYNCPQCSGKVKRGDIVIFVNPDERTEQFAKRVIALSGDTLRLEGTKLFLNEILVSSPPEDYQGYPQLLSEEQVLVRETSGKKNLNYAVIWAKKDIHRAPLSFVVPHGHAFVLGDNRSNSYDSRNFGSIPLADISQVVNSVFFPFAAETTWKIRWSRLAHTLEMP